MELPHEEVWQVGPAVTKVRMFALVNCGVIKHVAHRRGDCVTFGRECFRESGEYARYIRKGWFKVIPVEVRHGDIHSPEVK